jgi:NAD(P)-dependent dehydrogenase (short-subunit alcohol dehydrogenase family)
MGSAFAHAFAQEGADLLVSGRTASKVDALAGEIRAEQGCTVRGLAADMTVDAEIDALAAGAWEALDGLDVVLVSLQPDNVQTGDVLATPEDVFLSYQKAMVWAPLRVLRTLAPKMRERGGGSIITIVSTTGINPTPQMAAYGMAKGSLLLLTRYMAKEWGPWKVRVNAINPATVLGKADHEAMVRTATETGTINRISLGRFGHNSEVVGAAIYFASDESTYTTGQMLSIDGGRF